MTTPKLALPMLTHPRAACSAPYYPLFVIDLPLLTSLILIYFVFGLRRPIIALDDPVNAVNVIKKDNKHVSLSLIFSLY